MRGALSQMIVHYIRRVRCWESIISYSCRRTMEYTPREEFGQHRNIKPLHRAFLRNISLRAHHNFVYAHSHLVCLIIPFHFLLHKPSGIWDFIYSSVYYYYCIFFWVSKIFPKSYQSAFSSIIKNSVIDEYYEFLVVLYLEMITVLKTLFWSKQSGNLPL